MVQYYQYLNEHTVKNNYPLPLISQLVDKLKGAKLFIKMDLRWGYNNVHIKEGDKWKAAFICFRGVYEPLVMYFRLCNSPATFQTMMNKNFVMLGLGRDEHRPGKVKGLSHTGLLVMRACTRTSWQGSRVQGKRAESPSK